MEGFSNKRAAVRPWVLYLTLVISNLALVVYGVWQIDDNALRAMFERRQAVAELGAVTLESNLDRLKDVGVSLATRVRFRELIASGEWDAAVGLLEGVFADFEYLDRVFIADPSGTLMADLPELPGVRGQNFSHRDWYLGVSENWQPYVSEAYKRAAEPQVNVIAVAVPIESEGGAVLGILVLQVRTDVLFAWLNSLNVGTEGFVYIVDKNGHPIGHPSFGPQDAMGDFTHLSFVSAALRGEQGLLFAAEYADGPEYLVAYEPVSDYDWGVIVAEDVYSATASRREAFWDTVLVAAVAAGIDILLLSLLLATVLRMQRMSRELDDKVAERTHSLENERGRLHAVIENMADGVVVVDPHGRVTLMNAAAERLFGWTAKELLGKSFVEQVPMRDQRQRTIPEARRPITQALRGKVTGIWNTVAPEFYVRKDGTSFPTTATAAPIRVGGKILGAVAVLRDASREFEVDRAKSDFVTLTSHQLRTPLTGIQWYVQDMLDGTTGKMSKPQREHLRDVERSTQRMIRLVDDLLRVSQIELGQVAANMSRVDLSLVARRAVDELAARAKLKGISVSLTGPRSLPMAMADAAIARNVLTSLVANAIAFTPSGGEVAVRVARDKHSIRVSVSDTGIGVPANEQGQVFRRFFRASNAQTYTGEGTGLGLYIAKQLVGLSKGKIGFTSREGKGSTFWVSFPAVKKS